MKRLYSFIPILICLIAISSCQKAPELAITGPMSVEINADGGSSNISFTTNRDWTVTWSASWISVSPSSGSASDGPIKVIISCNPNTTYEDRSGTVTIKAEDLTQTVNVKQPANLGLIIPTRSYDIQSGAKTIEVEVQSNVQYSVAVSVDWIKQTGTKGLMTDRLVFSVEENQSYDSREGSITIKPLNGNVSQQVISVRQAQKDALNVKNSSYSVPYGGGEIEVKVESNVEFDVKPNVDWIHYVETKALNSSTVCLAVDENPTTSKREGKVVIEQKNGSLSHTITVKEAGRIAVTSVSLNKTDLRLKEGESETLIATVKPDNASDKTVTWTTSNASVADVDDNGTIYAYKEGTATITASAGGKKATCSITVKNDIDVTSVQIKQYLYLAVGESETLEATVKPDDATDKTVTWKSSNNSIVSVDSQGKVTAKGKGNATISATAGSVGAECTVFVKAKRYDATNGAIDLGLSVMWATKNYGASSPSDVGGYYLWGDPTGSGQIAFFNTPDVNYISGTQYDIATRNLGNGWRIPTNDEIMELLDFCDIKDISQNGNQGLQFTGPNGQSIFIPLSGLAYPADGAIGSTSIQSADRAYLMAGESYADGNGRFAYVWYFDQNNSFGQVSYNAPFVKIPVRPVYEKLEDDIPVSSVSLNTNSLSLKEGESATLVATVSPNNATDKTVTWSSSDKSIATVSSNGKVTAVKTGSAKITAQVGDKIATCLVSVQKASIKVTSITLNKSSLTLSVGSSETLIATLYPSNATETVHWGSSNPDVASVDSNGKVTGLKIGSATITAIAGEMTTTCNVIVSSSGPTGNIVFADANLKQRLVNKFDTNGDGELSYGEAAAVTDFTNAVTIKTITSFDEFQYFTGLTEIPQDCFKNWSNLSSIILPSSITNIGSMSFAGCSSLSSIVIPDGVTTIGGYAFMGAGLSSITIPGSVTSIGTYALSNTKITTVSLPSGVKKLENTFHGCTGLKSVTIPSGVTVIYSIFYGCTSLSSVSLPNSLEKIGSSTFYKCTSLASVTIPNSVTSIADYAFSGSGVVSISIPDAVKSMGKEAFKGCTSLSSIKLSSNLKIIEDNTFEGCAKLTSISFPESVTTIGPYSFSGCSSLSSITIPESITSIGENAFAECTSLVSITIPESVTYIGSYAFLNCIHLSSISIPESVTQLYGEFSGCTSLVYVSIPNSITHIGPDTFSGCVSLSAVTIPNSVKSIGKSSFKGCSVLKTITIPGNVTKIGASAFESCKSLTSITVLPTEVPTGGDKMFNETNNCSIFVPEGIVEKYKTAQYWSVYADRIKIKQ